MRGSNSLLAIADADRAREAGVAQKSRARALWYEGPGEAAIRPVALQAREEGQLLVRTSWSCVSRGTERLVYGGLTDPAHRAHMRAPMQDGTFPFPVKYGYCAVGRVEEGLATLLGHHIFALHPHQDLFLVNADDAVTVPQNVPPRRATLAANMETALNALWDSGAGAGDRIVVVGAGLVGLLIAYLAARLPGAEVTAIDREPSRAAILARFGATYASPKACAPVKGEADVVFHASATSQGLATALACCAEEATLVEVSWYGDHSVTVGLGGPFHAKRLRLISSQVGAVPPCRQPRWSPRRRLAKAMELLADPMLDALITREVAFEDLPRALPQVLCREAEGIATVVRYS